MSAKRTALITGASAGLGKDFAELFAADGHNLVLVARRRDRLEEIAADLSKRHNVQCTVEPADLSDPTAPIQIAESMKAQGIHIDFLVNNAGFGSNGAFVQLPVDGELGQIRVNIEALVHLTHLFVPDMITRGFGRVLNIASTAAFQAGPYMATYYATKAFVVSFSHALSIELETTGVTVTAHCPGPTATEFGAVAGNDKSLLFQRASVADSMSVSKHAYDAMNSGKAIAIHGVMNKMGVAGTRLIPRSWYARVVARLNGV